MALQQRVLLGLFAISMILLVLFSVRVEDSIENIPSIQAKTSTNTSSAYLPANDKGQVQESAGYHQLHYFQYSPVCQPSFPSSTRLKRIYFLHMRKAGGTTIKSFLKKVAARYQLDLEVAEALPIELPHSRSDTLYVTHVRDPVRRSVSHYYYDGRWRCKQLVANKTFVPTRENAVDFDTWVDDYTCPRNNRRPLWTCSVNCYIHWFTFFGERRRKYCHPNETVIGHDRLETARSIAHDFDIILDSDRLFQDKPYGRALERYFGMNSGLVRPKSQTMYCFRKSHEANAALPLELDNATLEDLHQRNQADYLLYDDLVNCGEKGVQFPVQTIVDFVHNRVSP